MRSVSRQWEPTCPHAERIEQTSDGSPGVVCGVMKRDQERADPILEGAPVGVLITLRADPSTLANFCCGQGDVLVNPDDMVHRAFGMGHYTGCPMHCAEREWHEAERLFEADPEPELDLAELVLGEQEITDGDVRELTEETA